MKLQNYFEKFHNKIKLDDENEELAAKREIILKKLRERLKKKFEDEGLPVPTFDPFNQGSYAMSTGVKPLEGDYDIDVGLRFNLLRKDYEDPTTVKKWVLEALEGHTKEVKMLHPCVRVVYQQGGEPVYHVDLAIYVYDDLESKGDMYLAKGRLGSTDERKEWELSKPLELIKEIRELFEAADDRQQFRRIVRYSKRWKNLRFNHKGEAAPKGIGLTIAAMYWFSPKKELVDPLNQTYKYDDLGALLNLVKQMLANFKLVLFDEEYADRLVVPLPYTPHNDLFGRMSNKQMKNFKTELESLKDALEKAENEPDPVEACKLLASDSVFGSDFEVPEKSETSNTKPPVFISSNDSA